MEEIPEGYKRCTKCKEIKPFSEFHKKSASPDGYNYECKICRRNYSKNYYHNNKDKISNNYLNNIGEIKERKRQYYKEHKEEISNRKNEYYKEHKEEISNRNKKYYLKNKEKLSIQHKQYYLESKDDPEFLLKSQTQHKRYRKCVKKPSCQFVGSRGAEFEIFTCEVCGKEFRKLKSSVIWVYENKGELPRFCSVECRSYSQRKGYKTPNQKRIENIIKTHGK